MGLFGRKKPVNLEHSAKNITNGLKYMREKWFDLCLNVLKGDPDDKDHDIVVKNPNLNGNGDSAIRAFQVYAILNYMAMKKYVPPPLGRDFADMLCAYVFAEKIDECYGYFEKYSSYGSDVSSLSFEFNSDVAKHFTQDNEPLMATMYLTTYTEMLVLQTHLVLSDYFQDKREAENKMKAMENYHLTMERRLLDV